MGEEKADAFELLPFEHPNVTGTTLHDVETASDAKAAADVETAYCVGIGHDVESTGVVEVVFDAQTANDAETTNDAETANVAETKNDAEIARDEDAVDAADAINGVKRIHDANTVEELEVAYEVEDRIPHNASAYSEVYSGDAGLHATILPPPPYDGSYDSNQIVYGGYDGIRGSYDDAPGEYHHQEVIDGVYEGGHGGGYEVYDHDYYSMYGGQLHSYQGDEYHENVNVPPGAPSSEDGPPGLEDEADGPPGICEPTPVNSTKQDFEQLPPPPPLLPGVIPQTVSGNGNISTAGVDSVSGGEGNVSLDTAGQVWEEHSHSHSFDERQCSPKKGAQRDRSRSRSPSRRKAGDEENAEVSEELPPPPADGGTWAQEYGDDGSGYAVDPSGYYDGSAYDASAYAAAYAADLSGYAAAYGAYGAPGMMHPAPAWDQSAWAAGGYGAYGFSGYGAGSYSQEMCRDFIAGRCHRGATCRYSHGTGDPYTYQEVCRDFLAGRCVRPNCRFSHNSLGMQAGGGYENYGGYGYS